MVVVNYVEPKSFESKTLTSFGGVEIEFPEVDLEPKVHAHQPTLATVLELLQLDHADRLSNRRLLPGGILVFVVLESVGSVVELCAELESRVFHGRLPLDYCLHVLRGSEAVLLWEEGLVGTVQISLEDSEVSQVPNDKEVLRIDFEHVQHVAPSGVDRVYKHDSVSPSLLQFEVVAVNQDFKFTRSS